MYLMALKLRKMAVLSFLENVLRILMDHSTLWCNLCENMFVLLKQVFHQCVTAGSF